jgi:hypothetical protein
MEGIEMKIDLNMTEQVKELLKERGIKKEDVKETIEHGESKKRKFYIPGENRFLGKKKIGNVTMNVEYSAGKKAFDVITAYSHRAELLENTSKPMATSLGGKADIYGEDMDELGVGGTEKKKLGIPWWCSKCEEKVIPANTEVTFMDIQRSMYTMTCMKCGLSMVEEQNAIQTLAAAEGLLEQKAA